MERLSTTSFGRRPLSADQVTAATRRDRTPALSRVDKWALFAELRTARAAFGLKDRSLAVLNALLSFLPDRDLDAGSGPLVVFPSNRALSDRAHGMAESTLRRHLATLVAAGLIARHDSPNGKRYAARAMDGDLVHAFGFDLRPFLLLAPRIGDAARHEESRRTELRHLRERLSLLTRDAAKLIAYGIGARIPAEWDNLATRLASVQRTGRRKLETDTLQDLIAEAGDVRTCCLAILQTETTDPSGDDARIERHHSSSDTDYLDKGEAQPTELPLPLVLDACPDAVTLSPTPIRSWRDLVSLSQTLHGFVGISVSTWEAARSSMGSEGASVVLCCILQRMDRIRNPGGYLRSLSRKAADDRFSPVGMVMSLLRGAGAELTAVNRSAPTPC